MSPGFKAVLFAIGLGLVAFLMLAGALGVLTR